MRSIFLIASTIFIESVRRKEIYAVIGAALLLVVSLRFLNFFDVEGIGKFYREMALMIMNLAASLTVIILAARQLPREFQNRTLYPLLAKPVSRFVFLMGKFTGVMIAACFVYGIFIGIFLIANLAFHTPFQPLMFFQTIYLQILSLAVLASLAFLLSVLFNPDAAVTLCLMLYIGSQIILRALTYVYDDLPSLQKALSVGIMYAIPQLTLLDSSGRVVHGNWQAIPWPMMGQLTLYALLYIIPYLALTWWVFRRKPL